MIYRVVMTRYAQTQLRRIIQYIRHQFKSDQAAKSILSEARIIKKSLSTVANSLKLCEDPLLHSLGYRKIHFKNHNYFFVYRFLDSVVYIEAVYHDLQDYEFLFKKML